MPNYRLVSAKEVLARVIRALGYKLPSTYHDDILEWTAEGIGMLQVTRSLEKVSTGDIDCPGEVLVTNYCAPLPCGFITMIKVEDQYGCKILSSSEIENTRSTTSQSARANVFAVDPYATPTSDGSSGYPTENPNTFVNIQGGDLTSASISSTNDYYEIQGNHIQTSFEEGFIKIYYLSMPVCKEGYPLIPDNQNLKQALEWHVIKRLIGSGYVHKVFSYDKADEQFEKYAGRAMNEVSSQSLDDAELAFSNNIRLVPPIGYADQFFVNQAGTI